jgi:hypothetical protein
MSNHDHEYYTRREREERTRAADCEDHGARMIHLEMADRYQAMLREIVKIVPTAA